MQASQIHSHFSGRELESDYRNGLKPIKGATGHYSMDSMDNIRELEKIGVYLSALDSQSAMDTIQPLQTTAAVGAPVQYIQAFLPGYVRILTTAILCDKAVGITTIGTFEDEQIIQGGIESTGVATIYNDSTNVPMAGFNENFIFRDVVRYEIGFSVSRLEQLRGDRMRISVDAEKRLSCTTILERARNQIFYYGYNSGLNNTYGFLNDPSLPAYQTVAIGATSGVYTWKGKTMLEITIDILTAIQSLRTQTGEQVNPEEVPITLFVATAVREYLNKTNDLGNMTAFMWLKANYPNIRVISSHELDAANAGSNVFYLYADSLQDGSTDGGQTFLQMVPVRSMVTGVVPVLKGYKESYANALAGILCKRPGLIYRGTGV